MQTHSNCFHGTSLIGTRSVHPTICTLDEWCLARYANSDADVTSLACGTRHFASTARRLPNVPGIQKLTPPSSALAALGDARAAIAISAIAGNGRTDGLTVIRSHDSLSMVASQAGSRRGIECLRLQQLKEPPCKSGRFS